MKRYWWWGFGRAEVRERRSRRLLLAEAALHYLARATTRGADGGSLLGENDGLPCAMTTKVM